MRSAAGTPCGMCLAPRGVPECVRGLRSTRLLRRLRRLDGSADRAVGDCAGLAGAPVITGTPPPKLLATRADGDGSADCTANSACQITPWTDVHRGHHIRRPATAESRTPWQAQARHAC